MKYFITIAILFLGLSVFSQRTINGRVTKTGGGILAGVKVFAKEAPSIFTLTDEQGKYTVEIPEEVTALVYSYSGMATKTVKIKEFNTINVKLTPAKYKTFRYGIGIAAGKSEFRVLTPKIIPDTISIKLIPVSLNANLFYRFNKKLELQAIIEDGLNIAEIPVDSVTSYGDTIRQTEKTALNRFTVSFLLNYHIKLNKTGNHSAFIGLGPQYQHISFLDANTVGIRFQTGININNYGFTTKFWFAGDISSGKFNADNIYVPDYIYKYSGGRFGVTFIF